MYCSSIHKHECYLLSRISGWRVPSSITLVIRSILKQGYLRNDIGTTIYTQLSAEPYPHGAPQYLLNDKVVDTVQPRLQFLIDLCVNIDRYEIPKSSEKLLRQINIKQLQQLSTNQSILKESTRIQRNSYSEHSITTDTYPIPFYDPPTMR